ncbi:hypothetical protein, partial [Streptomyces sp. 900105245]
MRKLAVRRRALSGSRQLPKLIAGGYVPGRGSPDTPAVPPAEEADLAEDTPSCGNCGKGKKHKVTV